MMRRILFVLMLLVPFAGRAETPEEWVKLGERVHGGFGAFLPVGIRIGLDALERLGAKPREVSVVYYDGENAPCPCIADGIMLATVASPGQKTLRIATEKAPAGLLGVAVVSHRKTGKSVRYEIPASLLPKLGAWNKALDPRGRYDAVMQAPVAELFSAKFQ